YGRGAAEQHVAADAVGHRRRRHAGARRRGQRAAPEDRGEALAAPAAHRRRGGGRPPSQGRARGGPAIRRPRDLLERRAAGHRVERSGDGGLAPRLGRARVDRAVRRARDVRRPRRLDPVHGHAGRAVPAGPVPGHRSDGAGLECPRAERVNRSADGSEGARLRGAGERRPRREPGALIEPAAGRGRVSGTQPGVVLTVLTGLNGLNSLDRYVAAATLPLILAGLAISDTAGGLLQSAFIVTY